MAKKKAVKASKTDKTTKKVTPKKKAAQSNPKTPDLKPVTLKPRKTVVPIKGSAASVISSYQIETEKKLVQGKNKEAIVNSSSGYFESVLKTLFVAGFKIAELDPTLSLHALENLPYGNFFLRMTHTNLDKLGGDGYVPNLFLVITKDFDRSVIAKYCVYFAATETTMLMPANVRGNWNVVWNQVIPKWYSVNQPKIVDFLDRLPELVSFIERLKARKLDDELALNIKKDVASEFLIPPRINDMKFLWEKSDKSEFFHKPIYPKEKNLFEALANVVALFIAKSEQPGIRQSISPRGRRPVLYYKYCDPSVWTKKNGKLAPSDIHQGKLSVPLPFGRRTYFAYSHITECVNKYLANVVINEFKF